jgi:hypothetical protein
MGETTDIQGQIYLNCLREKRFHRPHNNRTWGDGRTKEGSWRLADQKMGHLAARTVLSHLPKIVPDGGYYMVCQKFLPLIPSLPVSTWDMDNRLSWQIV